MKQCIGWCELNLVNQNARWNKTKKKKEDTTFESVLLHFVKKLLSVYFPEFIADTFIEGFVIIQERK